MHNQSFLQCVDVIAANPGDVSFARSNTEFQDANRPPLRNNNIFEVYYVRGMKIILDQLLRYILTKTAIKNFSWHLIKLQEWTKYDINGIIFQGLQF